MANMIELIDQLWFLKRDIVSDGYDQALYQLAEELPMTIHKYPTGKKCWTWQIPEKWTCQKAYLETMDGQRLVDYDNHPLHVVSYSLPFDGVVSRDELLEHLHVHQDLPDAIPFVFKYYERDWGLCASKTLRDSLVDEQYRVLIQTTFEQGELKVGEVVVPGESSKSIVLGAHLCHPAMVNDDLTGVVVGLEVFRQLLKRKNNYYTYRFLIMPETIGSIAYLSHNEHLIPDMVGGLFLEMLGNDSPHALQKSYLADSQIDMCFETALIAIEDNCYTAQYRKLVPNDERQFNSPGVRVPMLSLSRVEEPAYPPKPYKEYHSSLDTPEIIAEKRLEESKQVVLDLIDALEKNQYIINLFKGEVFLSGYGIWVDYRKNPEGSLRLVEIMERCDGEHTVADIAKELGISFQSVWDVVDMLHGKELVQFDRCSQPTTPVR